MDLLGDRDLGIDLHPAHGIFHSVCHARDSSFSGARGQGGVPVSPCTKYRVTDRPGRRRPDRRYPEPVSLAGDPEYTKQVSAPSVSLPRPGVLVMMRRRSASTRARVVVSSMPRPVACRVSLVPTVWYMPEGFGGDAVPGAGYGQSSPAVGGAGRARGDHSAAGELWRLDVVELVVIVSAARAAVTAAWTRAAARSRSGATLRCPSSAHEIAWGRRPA